MLAIFPIGNQIARQFLDRFHPLGAGGALRGARYVLGGFEDGRLSFVALLTSPRSLDKEVVAVVTVQWRQTKDGKARASRRLFGLYEVRNGEAA
jgi:hypothetical protein